MNPVLVLVMSIFLALGASFVIPHEEEDLDVGALSHAESSQGGSMQKLAITLGNSRSNDMNLLELTNALVKGGIEETVISALRNEEGGESEGDLKAIGGAIKQGFLKLQEKASTSDKSSKNAVAKGKAEESLVHVDVQGPPGGRQIGQNKFKH